MPRQVTTTIHCTDALLAPSQDIQRVSLTQSIFDHHAFEILVPFDQVEGATTAFFTDTPERLLGQPLTLQVVADSFHFNLGQKLLFKGIVTHLDTGKDNEYSGSVRLRGYSPCQLLDSGRKKRTFISQSLGAIFNEVLEPFPTNLLARAIAPEHRAPIPYAVQYLETNFDFLARLAAEYGEWFYYDGRSLRLGPPERGEEVDFWADGLHNSFRFGMTLQPVKERLHEYGYEQNAHYQSTTGRQQLAGGRGQAHAAQFAQPFLQVALGQSEKLYAESHRGSDRTVRSIRQLDEEALLTKANTAAGLVTIEGTSDDPELQVGRVLNIRGEGIGSRHLLTESFGKYRIIGITHAVDGKGNYSNAFSAVPLQSTVPPRRRARRLPAGNPELAEVIDDKDPAKLGRLRVRYYWPVENRKHAETDWIRVLTPYSGDGKGHLFNPEIGSQVMVAYEDSAAEQPFVLGNMFHADNPQAAAYSRPDNHLKGISTAGGNKVTLNDMAGALQMALTNSNNKGTAMELGFDGAGRVTIKTLGPVHVSGSSITLDAGPLGEIHLHARRISMVAEQDIIASTVTKDITLIAKENLAYQARQVTGKAEDTMHLDGGQKLTSSSDDSYYL